MAQALATSGPLPNPYEGTTHEAAFQAMRSAYLLISERFEKELAETGLPDLGFFGVLLALDQAPEPSRPRDLLCKVNVTKSGLTRLVDRIEKAGLLERTYCPSDRRGTFLVITDQGRETLAKMLPVRERVFKESFVDLVDEGDAETVARTLEAVSQGIYESLNADGSCDSE
ncbi:MAG: MarR family transcriptional regulator [Solirubrobacterales bacterium]|nr:MarR family transcriptional regulator [Solirubrobacterales bacterium]